MNTCFDGFEGKIHFVPSATHPIELRSGALAALLLHVGISPLRRRALPSHRCAAHSGASLVNYAG